MTTQTAEQLAYQLEVRGDALGFSQDEAAAMLRSQAAEIERLRKALIMCHTSLCYAAGCIENMTTQEEIKIEIGIDAARAALEKQA